MWCCTIINLMSRLFSAILRNKLPFVYFHTHIINRAILDRAVAAGRSLEIDISMNDDGGLYIGHPPSFYTFKCQPLPDNLPLDIVLEAVVSIPDMYVVLDCKDVRALPRVNAIVSQFGIDRVIFHSWIDSLSFMPYPSEIVAEPHWLHEDLPTHAVRQLQRHLLVPIIVSARGLTVDRLESEGAQIVNHIITEAKGWVNAVNFNLPNAQAPSMSIMHNLLDQGILTWLNIDSVPPQQRPDVYLGMTDNISLASRL